MAGNMTKKCEQFAAITITNGTGSPINDFGIFSSGVVLIPNAATVATLTYYLADSSGTLYAAYDSGGSAVTQTVAANRGYPIPLAVMGAGRVQIRSNVASEAGIILVLKT